MRSQTMRKALTIIIPVYNEEGNIFRIQEALSQYMEKSSLEVLALFVNDGSSDQSLELIKQVCTMDSRFGFISFKQNRGLSAAIKAGFDHAESHYVGYMDADLQTTPLDFCNFEAFVGTHELVTGERQNRQDGWGKRFSSNFANWFRNSFLQDGMKDTGCPLKIFQRDFALKLPYFNGVHRFFPALTQIYGGQVKVLPVQHFPRQAGVSKFNAFNRIVQPLLDTLLVHRLKKRAITYTIASSQKPLISGE
ncbi:MAG: glycosyltransferase family 2 protein [Mongoliitalea sp.]